MSETTPERQPDSHDALQRSFATAVEKMQGRRRYYAAIGVLALLVALGVMFWVNTTGQDTTSNFSLVWTDYERARDLLEQDLSAARELARLEKRLASVRGTGTEPHALWLLAIGHYREAFTTEKVRDAQRKPHLQKAAGYLNELRTQSFDESLINKESWFVSATGRSGGQKLLSPVKDLLQRIERDIEWSAGANYEQPKPAGNVVAVLRTSLGDVHLQFFADLAPKHTENFLTLALLGSYNETAFDYVYGGKSDPRGVRAGDPYTFFYNDPLKKDHILRWGQGSSGNQIPAEESRSKIQHDEGIVCSERSPSADWDNGIIFRIATTRDQGLDRIHTPFAVVVEGMSIVQKITQRDEAGDHETYRDKSEFRSVGTRSLLVDPVIIHKVVVFRNGVASADEHKFPLDAGELKIGDLGNSPVKPLAEDPENADDAVKNAVFCGRTLLDVSDIGPEDTPAHGLQFPFPRELSAEFREKDDPAPSKYGDRKDKG
ncbi:MAG: peptidylprolyl isomerase [Planctomycetota bacterium]